MGYSRQLLQQALELSQSMRHVAESSDWEQVGHMDEERMALLKTCLVDGIPDSDSTYAKAILEDIQRLNADLLSYAGKQKAEVQEALQLLQKGRNASAAYDACQNT